MLVSTTTGKPSKRLTLLRAVSVSVLIVAASDLQIVFVGLIIIWMLPITFNINGFQSITILNFATKTTFVPRNRS